MLGQLRVEYKRSGRGEVFETLKVALTENPRLVSHAELARRLGTTAGAVQVAVHRLRRRYRELVREAIAATVADGAEVEDEIRDLFAALGDDPPREICAGLYGLEADPVKGGSDRLTPLGGPMMADENAARTAAPSDPPTPPRASAPAA